MSSYHSKGSAACLGIDADPQTSFRTSSGNLAWLRVDLGVTRCVWNVNIICSNLTSNGEYQTLISQCLMIFTMMVVLSKLLIISPFFSGYVPPTDILITVTSEESETMDDVNSWCGQIESALSEDTLVVCDDPMSGRFVQVHNRGHNSSFHLAEVEVFGF